jgi:hypothetical protein
VHLRDDVQRHVDTRDTPADVTTPSSTKRGADFDDGGGIDRLQQIQRAPVRRRVTACASRPSFASSSAPVQTEVTRDARPAVARIQSNTCGVFERLPVPKPPGTSSKSIDGASSKQYSGNDP